MRWPHRSRPTEHMSENGSIRHCVTLELRTSPHCFDDFALILLQIIMIAVNRLVLTHRGLRKLLSVSPYDMLLLHLLHTPTDLNSASDAVYLTFLTHRDTNLPYSEPQNRAWWYFSVLHVMSQQQRCYPTSSEKTDTDGLSVGKANTNNSTIWSRNSEWQSS